MNKRLVLTILLCSTVGNVAGCDNEDKLPNFSITYKLLRLGLWLSSEPDPTRSFGPKDWVTNSPLLWFNTKDGKAILLEIAENHSLSLEKNRSLIYEITRIPLWMQFEAGCEYKPQQGYGLTVAIENGRFDLATLMVNNYWRLTRGSRGSKFLRLLIDNEKEFEVKDHELICLTNRFLDGRESIFCIEQYNEQQEQDSMVIKCVKKHNKKIRIPKIAQDEKLFKKYIKKD